MMVKIVGSQVVDLVLGAGMLIILIRMLVGMFRYVVSQGDALRVDQAQGHLTRSLVGLLIVVMIFVVKIISL